MALVIPEVQMRATGCCLVAWLLAAAPGAPQAWPQWRGPARDGVVSAAVTPDAWPAAWQRAWAFEIGEGYASPVVVGDRAYTFSRQDPLEVVTALSLTDGTVFWQQLYQAPFEKNPYALKMAKGPYATPLVDGGRLYTVGVSGIVSAWSLDDGRPLWRRSFVELVDSTALFGGTAASPLMVDGLLVVQVGSDVHGGVVLALDSTDGAERWRLEGPMPGYASPIRFDAGGVGHLVVVTQESLAGLDPATGVPRWTIPFLDELLENIVTPVWTGAELIMSGTRAGTHAYRLVEEEGAWSYTEIWTNPEVTFYMSSPVLGDGLLYGLSSKRAGRFVALDTASGEVTWSSEGRAGEHATAVLTAEHLVLLTNEAQLLVVERGGAIYRIDRSYTVADSQTWTLPVLLDDGLLVRDETHLVKLTAE